MMKPDIYKVKLIGEGLLAVMAKPVSGEWVGKPIVLCPPLNGEQTDRTDYEKSCVKTHLIVLNKIPVRDCIERRLIFTTSPKQEYLNSM